MSKEAMLEEVRQLAARYIPSATAADMQEEQEERVIRTSELATAITPENSTNVSARQCLCTILTAQGFSYEERRSYIDYFESNMRLSLMQEPAEKLAELLNEFRYKCGLSTNVDSLHYEPLWRNASRWLW